MVAGGQQLRDRVAHGELLHGTRVLHPNGELGHSRLCGKCEVCWVWVGWGEFAPAGGCPGGWGGRASRRRLAWVLARLGRWVRLARACLRVRVGGGWAWAVRGRVRVGGAPPKTVRLRVRVGGAAATKVRFPISFLTFARARRVRVGGAPPKTVRWGTVRPSLGPGAARRWTVCGGCPRCPVPAHAALPTPLPIPPPPLPCPCPPLSLPPLPLLPSPPHGARTVPLNTIQTRAWLSYSYDMYVSPAGKDGKLHTHDTQDNTSRLFI